MDDRELLEMAAKASGLQIPKYIWADYTGDGIKTLSGIVWNPLTDDGDALRLAMRLYMFDGSMFKILLKFRLEETLLNSKRSTEEIFRRAIVRTAAEIGRGM